MGKAPEMQRLDSSAAVGEHRPESKSTRSSTYARFLVAFVYADAEPTGESIDENFAIAKY
jgi:hypothetical protein